MFYVPTRQSINIVKEHTSASYLNDQQTQILETGEMQKVS